MFWEVNHSYFIFFVSELPSLNMFLSLFFLNFSLAVFIKFFKFFLLSFRPASLTCYYQVTAQVISLTAVSLLTLLLSNCRKSNRVKKQLLSQIHRRAML